jgi:hypothetical protein
MIINAIDMNLIGVIDSRKKLTPIIAIRVVPAPDQTE